MYVRKKTISRDELTIKIGSLSIEQVEHINDPLDSDEVPAAKLLSHPSMFAIYRFIGWSLTNAGLATSPGVPWSPLLIEQEFDLVVVGWLQDEVLEFNNLKAANPGESSAAAPTA